MMNFKKQIYIVFLSLVFVSCNSNKNKDIGNELIVTDSVQSLKKESIDNSNFVKVDSVNKKPNKLPIHGKLNRDDLAKYYPKITDTIQDLRIIGSEKINLNPGNEILVSLLHNTGTFDQMILCTHNKKFELIDNLYIGKATAFDNGKSRTIEFSVINENKVVFEIVDWGYVKKDNEEEIEPVKKERLSISINEKGLIKYKKDYG